MHLPGGMGLSLERRFTAHSLPLLPKTGNLVVGVSGGADSIALLQLLCRTLPRAAGRVVPVHVNHGLRPGDGDRDERSVLAHCRRLGLVCRVARCNIRASAHQQGLSLEEAGRLARQEFLLVAARQCKGRAVLLAHHQDDQAETLLLNLLRGAGARGLSGLRPARLFPHPQAPAGLKLLRPLLPFRKQELRAYLRSLRLDWREDLSNQDLGFVRNRIRHRLLPYLEKHFSPRVRTLLARSADVLSNEYDLLAAQAARSRRRMLAVVPGRGWRLKEESLRRLSPAGRAEMLSAVWDYLRIPGKSHDRLMRLEQAFMAKARTIVLPGHWRLESRLAGYFFQRVGQPASELIHMRQYSKNRPLIFGVKINQIAVPKKFGNVPRGAEYVILDAGKAAGPLSIGIRKPGDSMRILGMGHRRKSLKKIMSEMKIPYAERSDWPILLSGREVIWIYRGPMAESVKLDKISQKALKIEIFKVADPKTV